MDDNEIIELYRQRDETALRETEKKYKAYCAAVAESILSDKQDCEECVNDTLLRAWNSIPPECPSSLKLFLARITRNLSFDRYRANRALKRGSGEICAVIDELEQCVSGSANVEKEAEAKELAETIERFLDTLGLRDRSIFLRRYFYSEKVAAISEHYSLKESNVLMILSRTRRKLRAYLEKEGYYL